MRYTTELVLRRIDEFHCDHCGEPVKVGGMASYDLATGAGYCSQTCARAAGCGPADGGRAAVEFYPPRPVAAGKGVQGV